MGKRTASLLPATNELLRQFGDRLRLARLRRRLPAKQVAERAGMSPMTLRSLERGGSGVTVGAYLAVMQVLGIEKDLGLLGQKDEVGRELQDVRLPAKRRASAIRPVSHRHFEGPAREQLNRLFASLPSEQIKRALEALPSTQIRKLLAALPAEQLRDLLDDPARGIEKQLAASEGATDWVERSGFTSSETLARLVAPTVSPSKKRR